MASIQEVTTKKSLSSHKH